MQYSPPLRKTSFVAVLITGVLFIVSPALAQTFPAFETFFIATAQIFLLSSLLLSARYLLPRFHYRLEENEFIVIRVTGKRVNTLCRLDLSHFIKLSDIPPASADKRQRHLNACQNLFPRHTCKLLFEDDDTEFLITIECDTLLEQALRNIEYKTKNEVEKYD